MRRATLTNSMAKGVLDPHLSERTDLAHWHQSLAEAENCIFGPQGGVADRGGTTLVTDADVLALDVDRRLRRRLEPIPLTAANVTAVNGGTAETIVDQDAGTALVSNAVAITPWSLVDIDLGVAKRVDCIDVIGLSVATVGVNEVLAVEWWDEDDEVWRAFGGSLDNAARKHVRVAARTRRFAGWPGVHVVARKWRVALHGAAGAGAVTLKGLRFWAETDVISPRRLICVARSSDEAYELVLTDRNIDVFRDMRWQAAIPVAIAGEQIDSIWDEASLDTLLLFHQDIETIRIVRQGSDGEWDVGAVPWANVPALKVTTAFSGSQDEIQIVGLTNVTAGASVVLMLGDLHTAPITYVSDAQFAADAQAAIGTLPGLSSAEGDIAVTVAGTKTFRVAFQNGNGSRAWPLLVPVVLGAASAAPATINAQRGVEVSETAPLFGVTTGWPRCGAFGSSRLIIGGFRAAPTSWAPSVVALYYDFDQGGDPLTADRSFVRALDVDEVETIEAIFVGRHLQLFTTSGEWYIEARTLDATQAQNAILATRHGIASAVPLVFADGSTLFVQKGGKTLRGFLWRDGEQSYSADPLSVLGPHLLTGVIDVAHRSARDVREGNQIMMVNADGSAAMLTLLTSQDVIAIAPWSTPGDAFRAAASDINHNLLVITERAGDLYLEKWVPTLPLDAATTVTGAGHTSIAHLAHLEGRAVWCYLDDDLIGPLTVTDGAITLPRATVAYATAGLAPPWRARLPVERGKPNEERPFRPPMRIYEVELSLDATGDITIATNGGAHRPVPLLRFNGRHQRGGPLQTANGGNPQLPMLQRLYTGDRRVQGLTGFVQHAYVELSRSVPAPVRVKAVRREIAYNG